MFQDPVPTPSYTMPELLMLLAAIGTLVGGVCASVANMVVTIRTGATIKQNLKENTEISAATLVTAKVVEGHVNSERSKLGAELDSARRENDIIKTQLTDQSQTAALLAASTAQVIRQRQPDPNAQHNRRAEDKAILAEATLEKIETNDRSDRAPHHPGGV
jgi:hypothetical protein